MPGCSGKKGSSTPWSYWVAAASVSVSSERRGGRNNKYNANKCMTMHDMTKHDARCALTRYKVVPVKGGKHPGNYPRCFAFSDRRTGGGKLRVCYARDAWRTNGLRIWIRLAILSNFHVESISIRVMD